MDNHRDDTTLRGVLDLNTWMAEWNFRSFGEQRAKMTGVLLPFFLLRNIFHASFFALFWFGKWPGSLNLPSCVGHAAILHLPFGRIRLDITHHLWKVGDPEVEHFAKGSLRLELQVLGLFFLKRAVFQLMVKVMGLGPGGLDSNWIPENERDC